MVRKLLLVLLVALLPLHWSSAALAALCLPQPAADGHAHPVAARAHGGTDRAPAAVGPAERAGDAHARHAPHAHGPGLHPGHGHAAHAAPSDGAPTQAASTHDDAGDPAAQSDGGLSADAAGCCHAACPVLPTRHALRPAVPTPAAIAWQPAVPALSYLADGLFRPPRPALA